MSTASCSTFYDAALQHAHTHDSHHIDGTTLISATPHPSHDARQHPVSTSCINAFAAHTRGHHCCHLMQRPPQCCICNPCLHVRYRIDGINPTHLSCPRTGKQQWLRYQHLDPPRHPQCMLETILSAVSRSTILHPCLCNTCLRTIAAVPTTSPHIAGSFAASTQHCCLASI